MATISNLYMFSLHIISLKWKCPTVMPISTLETSLIGYDKLNSSLIVRKILEKKKVKVANFKFQGLLQLGGNNKCSVLDEGKARTR